MKEKSWIVFFVIGILILVFSLNSMVGIPVLTPDNHWDWLTQETDVLQYIRFNFLAQGAWQLGFALLVIITAVSGFRQGQVWAWYAMWVVPLLLIGLSVMMYWVLPITIFIIIAAIAALLASRPTFFSPQTQPA